MTAARRMRLQEAFRRIERKRVCHVGHSIGLTFNLAIGTCQPMRRQRRRHGRPGGYMRISDLDIFVFSSDWRLWGGSGYRLESRNNAARIARELQQLRGSQITAMTLVGSPPRLVVAFQDRMRLELLGDERDLDDPYGWNVTGSPGLKPEILSLLD